MVACGVDIKGSSAILAVANMDSGQLGHILTETRRIDIGDDDEATNVRSFSELVESFLRDNNVQLVAIKKRSKKGEYAGGATTFKIEGVFQLIADCEVELVSPQSIAAQERREKFPIPETLNKYQIDAFKSACALLKKRA